MEKDVVAFLKHLGIPVSSRYCRKLIQIHPDYPSFLSIADTLGQFGLRYQAVRINGEEVAHVEPPFLVQKNSGDRELRFIKNENDLDKLDGRTEEEHFNVLQVQHIQSTTDAGNDQVRKEDKIRKSAAAVLGFTIVCLLILYTGSLFSSWITAAMFITAISGVAIGVTLFVYDLGFKNRSVQSFCNAGKHTSCEAVLDSDKARVFGSLKWSDAVLAYFVFQTLVVSLLLPAYGLAVTTILAALSFLALPVALYMLYLQYAELRLWCKLCLLVEAVLFTQAGLFMVYMYQTGAGILTEMQALPVVLTFLVLAGVGSAVILLKSVLEQYYRTEQEAFSSGRVKYSPQVFALLLQQQKKADTSFFDRELLIGRAEAPVQILMAGSLGCNPCKEGFEKALDVVDCYPEKVSLAVRFLHADADGAQNGKLPPATTYLSAYWLEYIYGGQDQSSRTALLLHDWFRLKDTEKFAKEYPMPLNGPFEQAESLGRLHNNWMEAAEVSRTPTFFINGYELPENYSVDELKSIVPGIDEYLQQQLQKTSEFSPEKHQGF